MARVRKAEVQPGTKVSGQVTPPGTDHDRLAFTIAEAARASGIERWPASSKQHFALDEWSLCRLLS